MKLFELVTPSSLRDRLQITTCPTPAQPFIAFKLVRNMYITALRFTRVKLT